MIKAVSASLQHNYRDIIPLCPNIFGAVQSFSLSFIGWFGERKPNTLNRRFFNGDTRSPLPVYEGTPSIWHLAEILTWLREDKTYSIDDSLLEVAKINMEFNVARKWREIEPDLQENIRALVV
jgi:hypothetical protein